MLGNDCNKLMNMNSQICTQGSVLRQDTSSDPNNISQQFHRCAIKVQIPLLCLSERHRKSSLQQHGPPVPEGGDIHFPACLLFPRGKRDSHGISHPMKQELCHMQSLLLRDAKPRAIKIQISQHQSIATLSNKAFSSLSHPDKHIRTHFSDLGHATMPTCLGDNRIQLKLPSPAAELYPSASEGFQFLNIPIPSHPKTTPTLSLAP